MSVTRALMANREGDAMWSLERRRRRRRRLRPSHSNGVRGLIGGGVCLWFSTIYYTLCALLYALCTNALDMWPAVRSPAPIKASLRRCRMQTSASFGGVIHDARGAVIVFVACFICSPFCRGHGVCVCCRCTRRAARATRAIFTIDTQICVDN